MRDEEIAERFEPSGETVFAGPDADVEVGKPKIEVAVQKVAERVPRNRAGFVPEFPRRWPEPSG
jgi:hypothetical protein